MNLLLTFFISRHCMWAYIRWFKGIVSRDFWTLFWLQRFDLGPYEHWTGKNGFAIFDHKDRKSRVCVVVGYADTRIFLQIGQFSNFLIIPFGCVHTPKYLFCVIVLWEAFKVFKKCPHSYWCVRVGVDYANTRFLRISSQKLKSLRNRFCLFIVWGTGWIF